MIVPAAISMPSQLARAREGILSAEAFLRGRAVSQLARAREGIHPIEKNLKT